MGEEKYYITPENLGNAFGLIGDKIAGIPLRNIVDLVICEAVAFFLLRYLPLTIWPKFILYVVVLGGLAVINLIGIKGESLFQFLHGYITFLRRRRIYSLSPVMKSDAKN